MKRTNYLQHLTLENTYVKYRYNELLVSHTKLQSEISDLNRKLDQLYKNHANTVISLQEKNHHFSKMMEEKNQHIRTLLFDDDGKSDLTFSSSVDFTDRRSVTSKDDLGFTAPLVSVKPSH